MTTKTGQSQEEIYRESLALASDAPGVVPFLESEVQRFEAESARFQSGEQDNLEFTPFRLRQGVYGQRQADVQMIRVKIPGGILTTDALNVLGDIAERYAPLGKGHITTRENIQFHHIPLPECPDVLRLLGTVGLTSREACGNTVRNVVGSPTAGVDADEIFDPTPYLTGYVRFGVRHPITQSFPRKFKSAFTGIDSRDTVAAAIQDLTYVSQVRVEDGVEKRGFKVYVGGGTSIMPRLAKPLYEFLPEKDYLRLALAVWTVFDKADSLRKNRMMARLKVLIDRIGLDEFRDLVEAELAEIGPIDPNDYIANEEIYRESPPTIPAVSTNGSGNGSGEYNYWLETNVVAQKQAGYNIVYVKPVRGDLTPAQFRGLADILRRYTGGRANATQEQNLALRWVPDGYLHDVWEALGAIGLNEPGSHHISNVVSCPGTDSCKLGITSSMGLGRAVRDELLNNPSAYQDPAVKKMHVKISGCPNGCGQHHVANIGFHGAAMKGPSGLQIPAYELFLGGNYGDSSHEDTTYGVRVPRTRVPAKKVPQLVRMIAEHFQANRRPDEEFNDFLARVGPDPIKELAEKCADIPSLNGDSQGLYMDWEKTVAYKVERGEGECAV